MRQLGIAMNGSKRRQADRLALAPKLSAALERVGALPVPELRTMIDTGFGADRGGEDRFDSLVGLLALLRVIGDPSLDAVPDDGAVRQWEGWILGQPPGR